MTLLHDASFTVLGIEDISPDKIILKPSLLEKNNYLVRDSYSSNKSLWVPVLDAVRINSLSFLA